ncbi:hypothetical protein AVEN_113109-1 [Araneus ventricosus]|uniref:Uncharacterized protein n=1 Tax=Araneus ventricosus TaxID=182803 RepID=A0A4Y2KWE3_ARAVE|nr:hypothetical protein AVEN_81661-1 [Araneus ventricosus]GBN06562.1 hypothetical protein AVEN_113109-1 [Araneus ventricosus]
MSLESVKTRLVEADFSLTVDLGTLGAQEQKRGVMMTPLPAPTEIPHLHGERENPLYLVMLSTDLEMLQNSRHLDRFCCVQFSR